MANSRKLPQPDLSAAVRQSVLKGPARDAGIAVALSGGIDSIVLLDVLDGLRAELGFPLAAIHVNHGLSPHADAWESFCADECARRSIRCERIRVQLAPARGDSLEAVARAARYNALCTAARRLGARTVALAHHQDDQAETVLLQVLRGASPRGIAAMPGLRAGDEDVMLWRPLLDVPRRSIVDHAKAHRLRWIEDESNADARYRRNHLRHRVLPAIEEAFDGYRSGLARAAARAAEAAQLLDDLADADARNCASEDGLSVPGLRELGTLRAQNVIRRMLAGRHVSIPDADRLAEFVRQALTAGTVRNPSLPLDPAWRLASARGQVRLLPRLLALPFHAHWRGDSRLVLPHGVLHFTPTVGGGFAAARVPERGLLVRPREGGERCRVSSNRPGRSLKNLLQEAGIAAPLRRDWPLIVDDGSVVAVPGIGVSVDWQCPPGEAGWSVVWELAAA